MQHNTWAPEKNTSLVQNSPTRIQLTKNPCFPYLPLFLLSVSWLSQRGTSGRLELHRGPRRMRKRSGSTLGIEGSFSPATRIVICSRRSNSPTRGFAELHLPSKSCSVPKYNPMKPNMDTESRTTSRRATIDAINAHHPCLLVRQHPLSLSANNSAGEKQ